MPAQPSSSPPATSAPAAAPTNALRPRGPETIAQQTPDKPVATIAGKTVTAKQAADLLKPLNPQDRKRFENNLAGLVQQIYTQTQLADQASSMKLDTQSPWKEQLDISRANILTQAYLAKMSETGGTQDSKAYYDAHPADFDQFKLSGILVAFNPPGTPASSTTIGRTESQALEKANDLEKKIKTGGDFSAMARTDSDNQASSVRGGDLGTFLMGNQQVPADIKRTVSSLQTGQVSEPVRVQNGFYIFKVDNRIHLPFEQVQNDIAQQLKNEKAQEILKRELDKYKVNVLDPDFFNSAAATPSLRVPSLQRPASGSGAGTTNAPAPPPPGSPK